MIIHGYVIYTGLIDIFISFFCLNGSRSNILFYTSNLKLNDCDVFLQQLKKILRRLGFEPGATAWKAVMLTIEPSTTL